MVFTGLLFGAMMPYASAAMTMKSVGKAANDMVKECLEQFPKIMGPEKMTPDYERCIRTGGPSSMHLQISKPTAMPSWPPSRWIGGSSRMHLQISKTTAVLSWPPLGRIGCPSGTHLQI